MSPILSGAHISIRRGIPGDPHSPWLSAVLNASEEATFFTSPDGIIVHWNPAAERLFGYNAAEILGQPETILSPSNCLHEAIAILDHPADDIATNPFQGVRLRKDGTRFHASIKIAPVVEKDGRVGGWVTIAHDGAAHNQQGERVSLLSTEPAESMNGIDITHSNLHDLYVNRAFERLTDSVPKLVPVTKDELLRQARDAMAKSEPVPVEILNYFQDGTSYWIEMQIAPIRNQEGLVTHCVAVENGAGGRKQAAKEASHRQMMTVLQNSPDCTLLLDLDGRIVYINVGGLCLLERDDFSTLQGTEWLSFWEGEAHSVAHHALLDVMAGRVSRFQGLHPTATGTPKWWDVTLSPLLNEAGGITQILSISRDITEHHNLQAQLQEYIGGIEMHNAALAALATTDGLTGLKNYRAFQERLKEEYDSSARSDLPLSVLMLDVDNFKRYNDVFGHPAGDTVLRQVAQILKEESRNCDIVARYGGEEFAILIPGANAEEAKVAAERFRHAIEKTYWPKRAVTVSIGVTTLTPAIVHPDMLIAEADAALYFSKNRGRNCVTHALDPMAVGTPDTDAAQWYHAFKSSTGETPTYAVVSERVRESVLRTYDTTIANRVGILEPKDTGFQGHSERVTAMMERLARHLNLTEQEVLYARWGASLHDIGKMAIPDYILNKTEPLTEDEWAIMRQHTVIGYDMLKATEFLGPAVDILYCHHEKWDGSGYPRGLKAEEIPMMARLFAVIDVYDALKSDRVYRKSWPEVQVRSYLRAQSGIHFDPQAVNAFLAMLDEIHEGGCV